VQSDRYATERQVGLEKEARGGEGGGRAAMELRRDMGRFLNRILGATCARLPNEYPMPDIQYCLGFDIGYPVGADQCGRLPELRGQ
jgi:hypothetical protein